MHEYYYIEKIFLDIHTFIIDFVKLVQVIHGNSNETNRNMINIKIGREDFYLPATFNEISQRANELQNRLHNQIRILAQKRRNNISKGINTDNENVFVYNRKESNQFDDEFKSHLEQMQNNISDKNIYRIQVIIDAFELYDDIQTKKYSFNITFRLLPVVKHIQKQLYCISRNIQKILDNNTSLIEQHLRKLQQYFNSYDIEMKTKLTKFISRDIRPPVLVIPCPTNSYSPEVFARMRSSNAVVTDDEEEVIE